MPIRRSILSIGAGALAIAAVLAACEPDATPRAKDSAKWLTDFYTRYVIRGAWGLFGVEAKGKDVFIAINVPDQQSLDLLEFSEEDRKSFIALNACPPKDKEVWSMLDPDGDIILQARHKGNVFAQVSCKFQTRKSVQ